MTALAYYRKQADVCLRLASLAEHPEVVTQLLAMAALYAQRGAADGQSSQNAPRLFVVDDED